MKKLSKIFLGLLVVAFVATGCDSLLDVNSDRLVFPGEHQLDSPNDTIYSMVGIFTQLEKLSDRYVLLGELRGDLMDVTENANPNLREIYNFEISPDNPYNKIEDYYSVINNCNYLIRNIDTALVSKAEKVMYKEFAAAKAIRAWTYMQLALNYGKVKYYEDPILTIEAAEKNYQEISINELADRLIQDLEPFKDIPQPGSISLGVDLSSDKSFFPIKFLLGDLYLWTGQYENAAREYHDLMEDQSLTIDNRYRSTWTVENGVFVERDLNAQNWINIFVLDSREQISLIAGSTEYGQGADLDSLTWANNEIIPSETAIDTWNNQTYYYSANAVTDGDLRGDLGSYLGAESQTILGSEITSDINFSFNNEILKFTSMSTSTSKAIAVYRTGLLYLRYAEAVNRAGKPNLAFAVLKNGLNSTTLAVDTIVPRIEKYSEFTDTTGTFYDYVNFEDLAFDNNIGVHARGCGNVHLANDYMIPSLESLEDSIQFVEDKIVEELALETAFEGNRFHDLMRVALRRGDLSYLANKVAEKYTDNKEIIRSKLTTEDNWYLP